MDLTWWGSFRNEYWHDFVLHMERENLFKKDEETLEKLFCDRESTPENVIGIMNVRSKDRIDQLLRVAKATCKIETALIVFKTCSTGKNQPYFDEVYAYLLNKSEVIDSRKAFVSEIAGTLYMQLD
jgi:hypothetical protein